MASDKNFIRYRSGVSTAIDFPGSDRIEPKAVDVVMEEIYTTHMARYSTEVSWDERKRAIAHIMNLFGTPNIYSWFRYQILNNPYVHGSCEDFLLDTLQYIETGERDVSIVNRLTTVEYNPKFRQGSTRSKEILMKYEASFKNEAPNDYTYVTRWLSRPEGYDDLIVFAKIVFCANLQNIKSNHYK